MLFRSPCEKQFGLYACQGPSACEAGEIVCKAEAPSAEKCDGLDNDCDGTTDPEDSAGCVKHFKDGDGDSYGSAESRCLCASEGMYTALVPGDCDDASATVHPGGTEVCNQVDDDCDGETDEEGAVGCKDFFRDKDLDGYGAASDKKCLCGPAGEYTATQTGDCDDTNASAHPGLPERCNGFDDDCDGTKDGQDAEGCSTYYYDNDSDGWGVDAKSQCLCTQSGKFTASKAGDCDDNDGAVRPDATEVCGNDRDDDCDGTADEPDAAGCTGFFADKDADGWGNPDDSKCLCKPAFPHTATKPGDCDDADALVNPAAQEACNGRDDNCTGGIDEEDAIGCKTLFWDGDGDQFGTATNSRCLCGPWQKYTATQAGDCDDTVPSIRPGALESCNLVDDDCNGLTDDGEGVAGCRWFHLDQDKDGWGVTANKRCLCAGSGLYSTESPGDCDDVEAAVHPEAAESCNLRDDDCDGSVDEGLDAGGCSVYFPDTDGDGFDASTDAEIGRASCRERV